MNALKKSLLKIALILLFIPFSPNEGLTQPPPWAPAHGYRAKTTYIYFPQYNFYFDLSRRVYIIWGGTTWVTYTTLPARYVRINLGSSRQVELDIVTRYPYYYNVEHRKGNYKVKPAPTVVKQKTVVKPTKAKPKPPVIKEKDKPTYHPGPSKGKPGQGKGQGHGKGKGKG